MVYLHTTNTEGREFDPHAGQKIFPPKLLSLVVVVLELQLEEIIIAYQSHRPKIILKVVSSILTQKISHGLFAHHKR